MIMWELYLLTRLEVIFPILVLIIICSAGVLLHKCNDKTKGDVRSALECITNNIKK